MLFKHMFKCQTVKKYLSHFSVQVINAYLTCIARRYAGKALVIDSFQMTDLWKGKATVMKKVNSLFIFMITINVDV